MCTGLDKNPVRLTTGSAIDASPTWTPDGDGLLPLTSSSAPDATPYWSPDGQTVAFTSIWSLNSDILKLKLVDGVATRFTTNTGVDTMLVWSGDGSRLECVSSRNGKNNIHTIDADGTNDGPLTDSTKAFEAPSWR